MSSQGSYSEFASQVETIIQRDVEVYITEVVKERKKEEKQKEKTET